MVRTCLCCHYSFEPDDVWVTSGGHSAICVRCWKAEVHELHPVPKDLAREVTAVLTGISAWIPE